MDSFLDTLQALLVLVAVAAVGRVVLALLPVGRIGGHGLGELPGTWAASHLLGMFVCGAQVLASEALRVWNPAAWAMLAPWVLVAAARAAFLPGALVPRHAPRTAVAGAGVRALLVLAAVGAVAALGVPQGTLTAVDTCGFASCSVDVDLTERIVRALGALNGTRGEQALHIASLLALVVFVFQGLATARRSPLARALALAWFAWLIFLARGLVGHRDATLVLLAFGAGAGASVEWFRRGDRRALAVSALAFSSAVAFAPDTWIAVSTALGVLFVGSPKASWRTAALWTGVGATIAVALSLRLGAELLQPESSPPRGEMLVAFLVPALAIAASAYALRVLVLARPDPRERIAPTTRESLAVGAMLVFGSLGALGSLDSSWNLVAEGMPLLPSALLPLLPLVPLLVALVGAPDERTLPAA
ncbi:MAG: hypothetical protein U1F29_11520 [Planctomycetota bacterium]